MKWNESGFRPPLCTYRLNWARRTAWGWWDDWDDTVLRRQDSKFEPWRSEVEHATSRWWRVPTILTFTRGWGRNIFVSFKPPRPGTKLRTLAWKAAVLTTTLGPPPWGHCTERVLMSQSICGRPSTAPFNQTYYRPKTLTMQTRVWIITECGARDVRCRHPCSPWSRYMWCKLVVMGSLFVGVIRICHTSARHSSSCKAKRQYLLTWKVSRYCLLDLHEHSVWHIRCLIDPHLRYI